MCEMTQIQDNGYTVYKFTANNTDYEVLTRNGVEFDVFSKRRGASFDTVPSCYNSLAEMAKRSKAFANLAALINQPKVDNQ